MQIYSPSSVIKGARATLVQAFRGSGGQEVIGRGAMKVKSNSDSETYSWLGEAPRMRLLNDDTGIIYDGMSDTSYSLENQTWKSGFVLKREHFDDQQNGLISMRINQLGTVARDHLKRLFFLTLVNGETDTCYDGTAFFGDSHPARGQQTSTQDNLIGSGSGTSVANIQADLTTAIGMMGSFLAENGEPFDESITSINIVCPWQLFGAMADAVKGSLVSNTSNERFSDFSVSITPTGRFSDANDYYVLNTSNPLDQPIVIQERDGATVSAKTDGDDAFDSEIYKYQARWRGRPGYGHWQRAIKVKNT